MAHYVLIRARGTARTGACLNASESARALLDAGVWPLWRHTPHRKRVAPGDSVAIYLAGSSCVIATARVEALGGWSRELRSLYPLMLDGVPAGLLRLGDVRWLRREVQVRDVLGQLSFVPAEERGWGARFSGGVRKVHELDFEVLVG